MCYDSNYYTALLIVFSARSNNYFLGGISMKFKKSKKHSIPTNIKGMNTRKKKNKK